MRTNTSLAPFTKLTYQQLFNVIKEITSKTARFETILLTKFCTAKCTYTATSSKRIRIWMTSYKRASLALKCTHFSFKMVQNFVLTHFCCS